MSRLLEQLKTKALTTRYPKWKRITLLVVMLSMCSLIVGTSWFVYLTSHQLACHSTFILMTIPWLIAEIGVILFLYLSNNLPQYARDSIVLVLLFTNIWFGLFIFGLPACG
ncbi:hypothetical protein FLL45_06985 [Aliikangiella marina]|uniref:Uncharacterized protein n=1 Tax=Aliikangiella marina TaxID=1712262 RepID=A0A545TBX1_9GAMM|nr:hypothetical protein [Aliikangiella marina]TQV74699.1 hypothetical protein FLL45_06985 [Aliikangiella marina]